jgi:hypothetical protein
MGWPPTILVSEREVARWGGPLPITRFPVAPARLAVGCYGVKGYSDAANPCFIAERRTLPELAACARFPAWWRRHVERLAEFQFAALLIEGSRAEAEAGVYPGAVQAKLLFKSLDRITARGVWVWWCGDARGAARRLESLAAIFAREKMEAAA